MSQYSTNITHKQKLHQKAEKRKSKKYCKQSKTQQIDGEENKQTEVGKNQT